MSQTTAKIVHVPVAPLPWERFREVLDVDQAEAFGRTAIRARRLLASRVVWNRRPEPSAEPNLIAWTARPSTTIATAKPGTRLRMHTLLVVRSIRACVA